MEANLLKVSLQNQLGEALRSARKAAGLTQGLLAERARVSVPTVRLLEHGQGNLTSWQTVLAALDLRLSGRNLPSAPNLGAQLALLRRRRGLSQRQLAVLVDVSQPTLIALERLSRGRLATLDRVLQRLGAGAGAFYRCR